MNEPVSSTKRTDPARRQQGSIHPGWRTIRPVHVRVARWRRRPDAGSDTSGPTRGGKETETGDGPKYMNAGGCPILFPVPMSPFGPQTGAFERGLIKPKRDEPTHRHVGSRLLRIRVQQARKRVRVGMGARWREPVMAKRRRAKKQRGKEASKKPPHPHKSFACFATFT
jgi:hypothetical protein